MTPPPKEELIAPGVYRVTFDRWHTRRSDIFFDQNITREERDNYFESPLHKNWLEDELSKHDQEAEKILDDAGPRISSRNYREEEAPEWYASEIRRLIFMLRMSIRKGEAEDAAELGLELGTLLGGAKGVGYFRHTGGMRLGKKRLVPPFGALAQFLVRRNRNKTALELFEAVPEDEEIPVDNYMFYRDGERVRALMEIDGRRIEAKQSLNFDSFRKRVTQAKRLLSR